MKRSPLHDAYRAYLDGKTSLDEVLEIADRVLERFPRPAVRGRSRPRTGGSAADERGVRHMPNGGANRRGHCPP